MDLVLPVLVFFVIFFNFLPLRHRKWFSFLCHTILYSFFNMMYYEGGYQKYVLSIRRKKNNLWLIDWEGFIFIDFLIFFFGYNWIMFTVYNQFFGCGALNLTDRSFFVDLFLLNLFNRIQQVYEILNWNQMSFFMKWF